MDEHDKCDTCTYNKRCPIQDAGDSQNCKAKYYKNSIWYFREHKKEI